MILSTMNMWSADLLVSCSVFAALAHVTRGEGLCVEALDKVLVAMKRHTTNQLLSSQAACRLLFYHVVSPRAMTRLPQVTRAIVHIMGTWHLDDIVHWFGGKTLLVIHLMSEKAVGEVHGKMEAQAIRQNILGAAVAAVYVCVQWHGKGWNDVVIGDHPPLRR